jgi:tripeptide aminopeptidase
MRDAACDTGVIIADAVALAELPGGTGHERVRVDWLNKRLAEAPGSRHVDGVGNLVWTFGPPPYRLAVLVHVDDVFGEQTARGVTRRDGWLCGPGIGDNAIAVAVAEHALAGPGEKPLAVVFTVGEEGLGGLRGARHACRELSPEAVLALEGHGSDRVFTDAVGSLRVRLTMTGPGGHSWWDRGRPSAVHELVRLLTGMIASVPAPLSVNVGRRPGLLRRRGHARPDRTDPGRLRRRRRRPTAGSAGRDPGLTTHRELRNEQCCEPARTTSSRSATAGRCGSTASR